MATPKKAVKNSTKTAPKTTPKKTTTKSATTPATKQEKPAQNGMFQTMANPVIKDAGIRKQLQKHLDKLNANIPVGQPQYTLEGNPVNPGSVTRFGEHPEYLRQIARMNYEDKRLSPAHYSAVMGSADEAHQHYYEAWSKHQSGNYSAAHKSLLLGTKSLLEGAVKLLSARTTDDKGNPVAAVTSSKIDDILSGEPANNAEAYSQQYLGK